MLCGAVGKEFKNRRTHKEKNVSIVHLEDICEMLDEADGIVLPRYVAYGSNPVPPSNFEAVASILLALNEEEVSQF